MRTFLILLILASTATAATDALDEVNKVRARRGLPAFKRDKALSVAAGKAADYRAARRMEGHTSNDFQFVPKGSRARAAGCAAWGLRDGWGACCTFERWRFAGAAWAKGRDNRRYMHLFVR